jgi:hypothetical protein
MVQLVCVKHTPGRAAARIRAIWGIGRRHSVLPDAGGKSPADLGGSVGAPVLESRQDDMFTGEGRILMSTASDEFWFLAPVLSVVTIGLIIWFNLGQHKVRYRRMKKPFRLDMVRPPGTTPADMVNDLHAPPDSEFSIQLRVWPLLEFERHEIIFGFLGDPETKPIPRRALNEFIKVGRRREESPETNENNVIDHNDNYHIRESRHLSNPNNYTHGFVVQTREPGTYPIRFEMITDCGEGLPVKGIFLTVDSRETKRPITRS